MRVSSLGHLLKLSSCSGCVEDWEEVWWIKCDFGKHFFSERLVQHWLPREVVQWPSQEVFTNHEDVTHDQWAWWVWVGVGLRDLRGLFQP